MVPYNWNIFMQNRQKKTASIVTFQQIDKFHENKMRLLEKCLQFWAVCVIVGRVPNTQFGDLEIE